VSNKIGNIFSLQPKNIFYNYLETSKYEKTERRKPERIYGLPLFTTQDNATQWSPLFAPKL
jgi:hypothetical protein